MKRVNKITLAALFLVIFTTLVSCSNEEIEGSWEPMKWEANYSGDPKSITAPAEGGTYTLTCKNYQRPWLSHASTGDKTIYAGVKPQNFYQISHDWFDIKVVENTYHILIKANKTGKARKLGIEVTAGDVFDHIEVTQAK